jgi:hypothetical protein
VKPLFYVEGRPVFRGNILFHPDGPKTGNRVTAEFDANGASQGYVTVRTDNGAVPDVRIENLTWTKPILTCDKCGQILPKDRQL